MCHEPYMGSHVWEGLSLAGFWAIRPCAASRWSRAFSPCAAGSHACCAVDEYYSEDEAEEVSSPIDAVDPFIYFAGRPPPLPLPAAAAAACLPRLIWLPACCCLGIVDPADRSPVASCSS